MSLQLLPHSYIHLQVEGTDFIFGKGMKLVTVIYILLFLVSLKDIFNITTLTHYTRHIDNNHALCSDDIVSFEMHYNVGQFISSSRKSATVVGIGPCV